MKTLLLTLISLFIFSSCSSNDATANWLHDYDKALEVAQKENKKIYMFIAADKCKYCKMFKEQTLSNEAVMDKLNSEYVLLYLSRDQHFIPEGYERFGAPRHYFLTKEGKTIYHSFGFLEPDGFFLLLDEVELNIED